MQRFFEMFFGFYNDLFSLLNSYTFTAFGVEVSILMVFFIFIVLSMVITLFWKGARG